MKLGSRLLLASLALGLLGLAPSRTSVVPPVAPGVPAVAAAPIADPCGLEVSYVDGLNWQCSGTCPSPDLCEEHTASITVGLITLIFYWCGCGDGPPLADCSGLVTYVFPPGDIILDCYANDCTDDGCDTAASTPPTFRDLCACFD